MRIPLGSDGAPLRSASPLLAEAEARTEFLEGRPLECRHLDVDREPSKADKNARVP